MTIGVQAMTRRSVAAALHVVQPLCQIQIIRCNSKASRPIASSKANTQCAIQFPNSSRKRHIDAKKQVPMLILHKYETLICI